MVSAATGNPEVALLVQQGLEMADELLGKRGEPELRSFDDVAG
eukprot:gene6800-14673_t